MFHLIRKSLCALINPVEFYNDEDKSNISVQGVSYDLKTANSQLMAYQTFQRNGCSIITQSTTSCERKQLNTEPSKKQNFEISSKIQKSH